MRKLLSTLFLIIAFGQAFIAHAADKQSSTYHPPSNSTQEKIPSEVELMQEVKLLQEQNKLIHGFQTDVLTTVYWALGGVFTTLIVLAGYGWWSNFKMYEADKQRMQEDLIAKINGLEAKLTLRLQEHHVELERIVDGKSEAQLSRITGELTDIRTSISNLTVESNNRIQEINTVRKRFDDALANVGKALLGAESDLRFVEEFVWDTRDSPENILITQCQGIEACMHSEQSLRINNILYRMKDTLNKYYIGKERLLSKKAHDDITELLNKLTGNNKIPANEVLAVLANAKVQT